MSLLFTAASELKLRNDDCAESGSFFIMARSLIEAENCAIEPLSDIWIRVILRWQACLFACDALLLFIIAVIAGVVGNKPGSGYNAMPLRFQKAPGGVRTDHYRYSVRSDEKNSLWCLLYSAVSQTTVSATLVHLGHKKRKQNAMLVIVSDFFARLGRPRRVMMTASPDDRLIIQMDPSCHTGGGAAPHSSASNITSPTTMQHTAAKVKVVQGC